jgi:hypothetical protein
MKDFALRSRAKKGMRSGPSAHGAGTTAFSDPNAEGLEPVTRPL